MVTIGTQIRLISWMRFELCNSKTLLTCVVLVQFSIPNRNFNFSEIELFVVPLIIEAAAIIQLIVNLLIRKIIQEQMRYL